MLHFSARRLLNKLVDLRILLRDASVHLVTVAETWLSEDDDDALLLSDSICVPFVVIGVVRRVVVGG